MRLAECRLDSVDLGSAKLAHAGLRDVVLTGGSWANVAATKAATSSPAQPSTSVASSSVTRTAPATTATTATTASAKSATSAPASAAGTTLIAVLRPSLNEEKVIKEAFSGFEAQHPGIKVEAIEAPSGHYDEKTDALLAGGSPPALWFPAENRGYRYYASRDALQILDPFIATDKYDLSDFFPVAIDFCKWNGKYVAMPGTTHGPIHGFTGATGSSPRDT